MTGLIILRPASDLPAKDVVVTVTSGPVGAHVGIFYRTDSHGARRHLHLAWHFRLQDDPSLPPEYFWVEPGLSDYELDDVHTAASMIARKHADGRIPYGLSPDARFDSTYALRMGASHGLTCATFVMRVFDRALVPLLELTTWDRDRSAGRRQEDEAAQRALVEYLRKGKESRAHAELVATEIGCSRVRAEEVAAAFGMAERPIEFVRAEPLGRQVLAQVKAADT